MISWLFDKLKERRIKKSAGLQSFPHKVACWTCGLVHSLPRDIRQAVNSAEDFFHRHEGHEVNWFERRGVAGLWSENSDVKKAEQSVTTFTVTSLHSLTSSATVGWQGAVVDNTSGLYLDAQLFVLLDFGNTAPGSAKAAFIFAYAGIESGVYSYPASGSEGSITLSAVDTSARNNLPKIGIISYTVQDAVIGGYFSVRSGFQGWLPSYWGPAIINYSGATLASSGNTVKYRNTHLTVI